MKGSIFIGNPQQHQTTVNELSASIRQTPSGIFVVGGGPMVGKNTAVARALEATGLSDMTKDSNRSMDFDDLDTYGYPDYFESAYAEGAKTFVLGEIPLPFTGALHWLNDFYQQGRKDGRDLQIIFNTISKKCPPWKVNELKKSVDDMMSLHFPNDLHLFCLDADKVRIVSELWRLKTEDEKGCTSNLGYQARHIGFDTNSPAWYDALYMRDPESFSQAVNQLMNENPGFRDVERL